MTDEEALAYYDEHGELPPEHQTKAESDWRYYLTMLILALVTLWSVYE